MHRKILFGAAMLGLLAAPLTVQAASNRFDTVVRRMLDEYQKVHKALAADSTRDVSSAARSIEKLSGELQAAVPAKGPHAAHYKQLPGKIRTAAQRLARAENIGAAREAMKELSKPLARWTALAKPTDVNVVFCSMAKASWLQRDKEIRNPYYGAQMLRCGEVISGPAKGHAGGHMSPGHKH